MPLPSAEALLLFYLLLFFFADASSRIDLRFSPFLAEINNSQTFLRQNANPPKVSYGSLAGQGLESKEEKKMTKKGFLHLVLAVVGGLLFSLGMCMCLLPEWHLFGAGIAFTALGAALLLSLGVIRWLAAGRPGLRVNWHFAGRIAYCVAALLVLGAGMAMIMAFEGLLLPGLIMGIAGILLCLGIIPVCGGLK